MNKTVLIIDDDPSFLHISKMFLSKNNWIVETHTDWDMAKKAYEVEKYSVVLVDLNIGELNGFDIVEQIKKKNPDQAIGIITGHSSVESVVVALRLGVLDYITKPCENEEILIRLENIFTLVNKDEEIEALKNEIEEKYKFHNILTQDEKMIKLCEFAKTIAETDATVLLQGETGTGKELFAKAIHYASLRNKNKLVVVNCAGINENLLESHLFGHMKGAFTGAHETVKGKFEVVGEGTIFLDEISETSFNFQKKFLRVLEEKTFERVGGSKNITCNARVIAATNRDLAQMVEEGLFRKDLFYRLNVVPIHIPSLRERTTDIPLLGEYFLDRALKKFNKTKLQYNDELNNHLLEYSWPGNVRELEHYIEKMVLISKDNNFNFDSFSLVNKNMHNNQMLTKKTISTDVFEQSFFDFQLFTEKAYFKYLLKKYKKDVIKIADHAKTAKKTVYAKLHKYSLR